MKCSFLALALCIGCIPVAGCWGVGSFLLHCLPSPSILPFSSSYSYFLAHELFSSLFYSLSSSLRVSPINLQMLFQCLFPTIHFVFFYKRDVQLGSILSSPISQGSLKLFVLFEFFNSLAYRFLFYASLQAGQSADLFWFVHSSWPIQILATKGSISLHWHKCLSNKTEKCGTLFKKNTSSIQYCDISH